MITLFGIPFGVSNLALGSLLFLTPLLILAYFKKKPRKIKSVPSLFFLKQLKERPQIRKTLKLPIRFFLELIALLLLGISATGPFFLKTGSHVAILFDNSMSMGIQESRGSDQTPQRIFLAKEALTSYLSTYGEETTFSLYHTTPRVELDMEGISKVAILDALKKLQVYPAQDQLESAIPLLRSKPNYDQLLVVTDRNHSIQENITFLTVGKPHKNVYFEEVKTNPIDHSLQIVIATHSIQPPITISLKLEGLSNSLSVMNSKTVSIQLT